MCKKNKGESEMSGTIIQHIRGKNISLKVKGYIKKRIVYFFLFFLLPYSSVADVIFFKDRTRIDVEKTWEEDGQIKTYIYGQIVSYPKGKIDRIEKENSESLKNKWVELFKSGKTDEALIALNKSIKLDPNDAETYHSRAVVYQKLKEPNKAIADLSKSIQLNPNNGLFYHERSVIYIEIKNYIKAFEDIHNSVRLGYTGSATKTILSLEKEIESAKEKARLGNNTAQQVLKKLGIEWEIKKYADNERQTVSSNSSPSKRTSWYEGGTLHRSNVDEWNNATSSNKLATASDWAISSSKIKTKVTSSGNMDTLRPFASELVQCVNEAAAAKGSGSMNASELATGCIVLKGW